MSGPPAPGLIRRVAIVAVSTLALLLALEDAHADHLATYVHLTEEGNLRLAEALRDAIQPVLDHRR